ncbi:kinase-like domain-containing protein [Glomus cerebriforme]|uniref:Kinase-like domain-containing protein n=1 Tax=Glomus cerebriforme TaxID=658196 RepID=A0A397SC72_9GLOM|nr:kinase-like domain-containing protein [Glomus cerebriforme]
MEQKYLSDDVFEQIKDFDRRSWNLTEEQKLLIDKLILNEELKKCYKKRGLCRECKQPNTGYYWSNTCNVKRFQQNFKNWSSGNDDIDKFIQHTQLSATVWHKVLEWIPYDRFYNIKYIAKGGFGKVYRANWIDGHIINWDDENQNWERLLPNKDVALKSLNNSKNVTLEFINENGSLRNYLDKYVKLSWFDKINNLFWIAEGLKLIHANKLIHRDLHIGNILYTSNACITDMGLCKPADYIATENTKNSTYGVLPYIAPEILRGQNYTKAADIYSFGIIMYEVISGLPPYHDVSHDQNLALKICQGLRPRFDIKVPQLIVHLIKRCLDANQLNRPIASEVKDILLRWYSELLEYKKVEDTEDEDTEDEYTEDEYTEVEDTEVEDENTEDEYTEDEEMGETELQRQIKEANETNNKLQTNVPSTNLSYKTHSEAIYTKTQLIDLSKLKINNDW